MALPQRREVLQRGVKESKGFKPVAVPKDQVAASRSRVALTRNVTNIFRDAPKETVEAGRTWYPKAHDEAAKLGSTLGSTTKTGAGIIAAVSPSMSWENNIPAAHQFGQLPEQHVQAMHLANENQKAVAREIGTHERVLGKGNAPAHLYQAHETAKRAHMATRGVLQGTPLNNQSTDNIVKAARIRSGEAPESVLPQRQKTGHFFRNVADPSDPHAVTIDTHAHDASRMSKLPFKADRGLSAVGRYNHFADAYRNATPRVGESVPNVVQATVWQHWKNKFGNDTSVTSPGSKSRGMETEEPTGQDRVKAERGIAARSSATIRKHGMPAYQGDDLSDPWHPANQGR